MFRVAKPLISETNVFNTQSVLNRGVTISEINSRLTKRLHKNDLRRRKSILKKRKFRV